MAIPEAKHPVTCDLCRIEVNPIVARYLYLAIGWRGRPSGKPLRTRHMTFCGPCGDQVLGRVQPLLPRVDASLLGAGR